MIPSIFEYAPDVAEHLFKTAATSIRETDPEIVAPDMPAEPPPEPSVQPPLQPQKPPPHPYVVGLKQLLPIGVGTAAGFAAGMGIPALLQHFKVISSRPDYHVVGGIGALAGGIGGIAATIMQQAQQAEMARASQEYKDYLARRAAGGGDPSVQPPAVRA